MAILLLIAIIASPTVFADENEVKLSFDGEKGLIYNIEYQRFLYSEGKDEKIAPASLTKIMTAVLGFEYLKDHPDTVVTVDSYTVTKATGTKVGLKQGEEISLEELLYCMTVGSANDAALAIAIAVGKSEAEFVGMMNSKARELGMENTYFANPTGMDNSAMYTTLSDMARLCAYAYKINDYMLMTNTVNHTVPATNLSKARKLKTKNLLVDPNPYTGYHTPEVMGMSFGSTAKAGYCVATTVEKSGLSYVILISGGGYVNDTYTALSDARVLVDHALNDFILSTVLAKDTALSELPVHLGENADGVMTVSADQIQALLPTDHDRSFIRTQCVFSADLLEAPVEAGMMVGTVKVFYKDEYLGSCEIITQRAIAKSTWDSFLYELEQFFLRPTVQTFLKVAAVLLILAVIGAITVNYLRARKQNAAQRQAVKEYLKQDRKRFKEDQREYRRTRKEKRKRRKANFIRIKQNYHKYKLDKENEKRLEVKRQSKASPQSSRPPQAKRNPRPGPQDTPSAPPPTQRPGDQYYRK